MSNEEKFKQSLKSLVESQEFAFDEKDWDKAAAYIHRKRAGSRTVRNVLLVLAVAGVIATSLLLAPFSGQATRKTALKRVPSASGQALIPAGQVNGAHEEIRAGRSAASVRAGASSEKSEDKAVPQHRAKTESAASQKPSERSNDPEEKIGAAGKLNISFGRKKQTPIKEIEPPATNNSQGVVVTAKPAKTNEQGTESQAPAKDPVATGVKEPAAENTAGQEVTTQETLSAAPVTTQSQAPSVAQEKNSVPDSIKAKLPRVMILSCEAGPSYMFGWKNDGMDRDAGGLNPAFGIHYMSPIDSRFTLSFGLQYQRTGHLSAYSHTSKQSRYSFGEESEVMTITPSKLHYLALPLRLYYKVNEMNTLGASYSIGYLLDVESDVQSYTLKVGKQSNNKNYSTRGYTDGFSLFDSQLSLFFRRHLVGDFSAHAEVFFGLSDVKQNNFFGGARAQRNSGLRLMIVYGIHSRNR